MKQKQEVHLENMDNCARQKTTDTQKKHDEKAKLCEDFDSEKLFIFVMNINTDQADTHFRCICPSCLRTFKNGKDTAERIPSHST